MKTSINNPIMPGFAPDPSFCAANGKFYLATSTFTYFPGIPIYESDDCANWKLVGHAISRPEQMEFAGENVSRGLFAPTIRYNNGTFYMICTDVDKGGNFFVTATDPAGPWSNPKYIKNAPGIDPSLFFDDDGTVWYIGTRPAPEGCKYNGNWEIWVQQIDIEKAELVGESTGIWRGALKNCVWPEGPHVFKINGWYYLMHAEGGTGPEHAVCVARCRTVTGEWEGFKANPILTHRHMGKFTSIVNVGHADLLCDNNGKWWMVCLAQRPVLDCKEGKPFTMLGRETFFVPVEWQDEWPLCSTETGRVEWEYKLDGTAVVKDSKKVAHYSENAETTEISDFSAGLDNHWIFLREAPKDDISTTERPGALRLWSQNAITSLDRVCYAGKRLQAHNTILSATIETALKNDKDAAGIVLFQSNQFNYRLQVSMTKGKVAAQLIKAEAGTDTVLECAALKAMPADKENAVCLTADITEATIAFTVTQGGDKVLSVAGIDASILSTEKAGGFVGTTAGVFAESAEPRSFCADITSFVLKQK